MSEILSGEEIDSLLQALSKAEFDEFEADTISKSDEKRVLSQHEIDELIRELINERHTELRLVMSKEVMEEALKLRSPTGLGIFYLAEVKRVGGLLVVQKIGIL